MKKIGVFLFVYENDKEISLLGSISLPLFCLHVLCAYEWDSFFYFQANIDRMLRFVEHRKPLCYRWTL